MPRVLRLPSPGAVQLARTGAVGPVHHHPAPTGPPGTQRERRGPDTDQSVIREDRGNAAPRLPTFPRCHPTRPPRPRPGHHRHDRSQQRKPAARADHPPRRDHTRPARAPSRRSGTPGSRRSRRPVGHHSIRCPDDTQTLTRTAAETDARSAEVQLARRIAGYLAKYVTKSVTEFGVAPRRMSPRAIDTLPVNPHIRALLHTITDLAAQPGREPMLGWLHTLGYRGHVTTKSRQYSTTMTALRAHRADWKDQHPTISDIADSAAHSATDGMHRTGLDSQSPAGTSEMTQTKTVTVTAMGADGNSPPAGTVMPVSISWCSARPCERAKPDGPAANSPTRHRLPPVRHDEQPDPARRTAGLAVRIVPATRSTPAHQRSRHRQQGRGAPRCAHDRRVDTQNGSHRPPMRRRSTPQRTRWLHSW
jgi:hypothetical protein